MLITCQLNSTRLFSAKCATFKNYFPINVTSNDEDDGDNVEDDDTEDDYMKLSVTLRSQETWSRPSSVTTQETSRAGTGEQIDQILENKSNCRW